MSTDPSKWMRGALLLCLSIGGAGAQQLQPLGFVKHLASDQVAIWTSPKDASQHLPVLVPLVLGTGVLIATDHRTTAAVPPSFAPASEAVSNVGIAYMTGAPVALVLTGLASHDAKATGTGVLAAEALADVEAVVTVVKYGAMRERPLDGGRWWRPNIDPSFPSGHSAGMWAVSSVIAAEYRSKPVAILAYSAAAAVSASRFTAQRHHWSDIVIGSALGWTIGHYVARHHPID